MYLICYKRNEHFYLTDERDSFENLLFILGFQENVKSDKLKNVFKAFVLFNFLHKLLGHSRNEH